MTSASAPPNKQNSAARNHILRVSKRNTHCQRVVARTPLIYEESFAVSDVPPVAFAAPSLAPAVAALESPRQEPT